MVTTPFNEHDMQSDNNEKVMLEKGIFKAAMRIIRSALDQRINLSAQTALANDILCTAVGLRSASLVDQLFLNQNDVERIQSLFHHASRFNQLDLLCIGADYTYIIHRDLLLRDIQEYLSGSPKSRLQVFINADYRLSQPEIWPENRYRPLEEYVQNTLLPAIKFRIGTWGQAEQIHEVLPVPDTFSMVTLNGWLSGCPVNYVLPVPSNTPANGEDRDPLAQLSNHDGDGDEEEDVQGRNCLGSQDLVVTTVQLEPSEHVEELRDHSMMRFFYPANLAEKVMLSPVLAPATDPENPSEDDSERQEGRDDNDGEYVDASDVEYVSPKANNNAEPTTNKDTTTSTTNASSTATAISTGAAKATATTDSICLSDCSPDCMPGYSPALSSPQQQQQRNQQVPRQQSNSQSRSEHHLQSSTSESSSSSSTVNNIRPRSRRLPNSELFDLDLDYPLPFRNADISAAGRSFLHQLHMRFREQTVWKAWEVGQETVNLPIVFL
ncbi:hypothetical protein BG011_000447 [Mortierella polycephala]|uniref:Uncharacterized protein n=1 Tax=Mortierella polycephala TaxID=41804 RepID=A0A9P6PMF9_9FUNG|nr:hypothetical protein BG011_000447 [Mortierella polycephala]